MSDREERKPVMEGHEGHRVYDIAPNNMHNGMLICDTCGVTWVATKKPAEFITFSFKVDDVQGSKS